MVRDPGCRAHEESIIFRQKKIRIVMLSPCETILLGHFTRKKKARVWLGCLRRFCRKPLQAKRSDDACLVVYAFGLFSYFLLVFVHSEPGERLL